MYCEHCGAIIPDSAKFCPECGKMQNPAPKTEPETLRCPYCGTQLEPDSVFCENCGRNLSSKRSQTAVGSSAPERVRNAADPTVPDPRRVSSIPAPPPVSGRDNISGKKTNKKKKSGSSSFFNILLILIAVGGIYYLWRQYGDKFPELKNAVSNITGTITSAVEKEIIQLPEIDILSFFKNPLGSVTSPTIAAVVRPVSTSIQVPVIPTATQIPTVLPPAEISVPPTSVPVFSPTPTSRAFEFPTIAPISTGPTSVPASEDAYYYDTFTTSENPRQSDFLWVTEDILNGNLPGGRVRLSSILSLMGGWKVYIVDDPENQFGSGMERMCNAYLDAGQFGPQITFKWYYVYNRYTKEVTKDFSPDSVFAGNLDNGQMEATGSGKVKLTDFYFLDGKEYAVGTLYWPDGIVGAVFMVRP